MNITSHATHTYKRHSFIIPALQSWNTDDVIMTSYTFANHGPWFKLDGIRCYCLHTDQVQLSLPLNFPVKIHALLYYRNSKSFANLQASIIKGKTYNNMCNNIRQQ